MHRAPSTFGYKGTQRVNDTFNLTFLVDTTLYSRLIVFVVVAVVVAGVDVVVVVGSVSIFCFRLFALN